MANPESTSSMNTNPGSITQRFRLDDLKIVTSRVALYQRYFTYVGAAVRWPIQEQGDLYCDVVIHGVVKQLHGWAFRKPPRVPAYKPVPLP